MAALAGGIVIALAVIFTWSAGAKTADLVSGAMGRAPAPSHSMIDRPAVLAPGIALEALTAMLLVTVPMIGLWLAAGTVTVLTAIATTIPSGKPCRCFGSKLEFGRTRLGRLARNGMFLVLAVAGITIGQSVSPAPWSPPAVAWCGLLVAAVMGADGVARTPAPRGVIADRPSERQHRA